MSVKHQTLLEVHTRIFKEANRRMDDPEIVFGSPEWHKITGLRDAMKIIADMHAEEKP